MALKIAKYLTKSFNRFNFDFIKDLLSDLTTIQDSQGDIIPYTSYVATLTQAGTNAPTANVIYNNLGQTLTWDYNGVGDYKVTVPSATFTANKTLILIHNAIADQKTQCFYVSTTRIDINVQNFAGVSANDRLTDCNIEIRVYS